MLSISVTINDLKLNYCIVENSGGVAKTLANRLF